MQVLVAGAAGLLGQAIVKELRSCGYTVRAMVRSGRRVAKLRDSGATLEFGNLQEPRSLLRACYGAQALVIALPFDPFVSRRAFEGHIAEGMRNLIAAAREVGSSQVILVSALKANVAPAVRYLRGLTIAEAYLQSAELDYSIIRPAALHEWFGEPFPLKRLVERLRVGPMPGQGRCRHSFVAAYDVARTVRLALERPEARQAIIEIGGSEDLSFYEAYQRIATLTGRAVLPLPVAETLVRSGAFLAGPLYPQLHELRGFVTFLNQEDCTCQPPDWLVEALGSRQCFDCSMRQIFAVES